MRAFRDIRQIFKPSPADQAVVNQMSAGTAIMLTKLLVHQIPVDRTILPCRISN
jgi:hypothetical protein